MENAKNSDQYLKARPNGQRVQTFFNTGHVQIKLLPGKLSGGEILSYEANTLSLEKCDQSESLSNL